MRLCFAPLCVCVCATTWGETVMNCGLNVSENLKTNNKQNSQQSKWTCDFFLFFHFLKNKTNISAPLRRGIWFQSKVKRKKVFIESSKTSLLASQVNIFVFMEFRAPCSRHLIGPKVSRLANLAKRSDVRAPKNKRWAALYYPGTIREQEAPPCTAEPRHCCSARH